MADYRYYPPIVDSYLPAFVADGSTLRFYFGLSKYNSVADFSSVQVSVKKQNTGLSIVNTSEKASVTETKTGDGNRTIFTTTNKIDVVTSVLIDGVNISTFTVQNNGYSIEILDSFGNAPAAGSVIKITYQYKITNRYRAAGIILNLAPIEVTSVENLYYVEILNEDIKDGWTAGTIYQIQIRLSSVDYDGSLGESVWLSNNADNFSEWSTICVVKAIGTPSFTALIPGMNNDVLDTSSLVFRGYYTNTETSETLNTYQLSLIKDDEIIEETELLYPGLLDESGQYLSYTFKTELEDQNDYSIQASFETINKYSFSQTYSFSVEYSQEDFDKVILSTVENDDNNIMSFTSINQEEDDGRVCLEISLDNTITFPLTLCIRRSDYLSSFTKWEDLKLITLEEYQETLTLYDYTIKSGVFYKYGIQKIDTETDERSILKIVENPIIRTFEFSFLLGEDDQQLKLEFNNVLNSYKYNINEGKQDTLGGIYAFVSRNAKTYYQSFPISALISFNMDENNLFITKEKLFNGFQNLYAQYNLNNNLGIYDMTYEREFRKEVLKFLQNGKPKIFKSPSEGNVIVRLINVNCTPNKTTNRLIYSFTCEAIEIAEDGLDSYKEYGFASGYEDNTLPTPPEPGPGPTPPTPVYNPSNILDRNILSNGNYENIIYNFNSSTTYANSFNVEPGNPDVYYEINNNTLYISTQAPSIFWNTTIGQETSFIPNSISTELNVLFPNENIFSKVISMPNAFMDCNITGTPICGEYTKDMSNTYKNCKHLNIAICGNDVENMYQTYADCSNIINAVCGNNVIDMYGTYKNCYNLITPISSNKVLNMDYTYFDCYKINTSPRIGSNVLSINNIYYNCTNLTGEPICENKIIDMDYAYFNCVNLINNAACGINVINMNYAYSYCSNLKNANCGPNVINMYKAYENCTNLIYGICNNNVVNMSYTYSNCLNLKDVYIYSNRDNINIYGIINGRIINHPEQLNIWVEKNSFVNNIIYTNNSNGLLTSFNFDWFSEWDDSYYNSLYNIYVYYYDNPPSNTNIPIILNNRFLIPSATSPWDGADYREINLLFNSDVTYENTLNTTNDTNLVYYKIENDENERPILYLSTKAPFLYFGNGIVEYGNYFSSNLESSLNEIFKERMFDKLESMYEMFYRCENIKGSAICGINTIDFSYAYYFCNNLEKAVCGPKVTNMYYSYAYCNGLTEAACGPNVTNMVNAYYSCGNLIDAVCGDNVIDMSYAYMSCYNLINAVCGSNVTNMNSTYCYCTNLINAVCENNVLYMNNTYLSCYNLINAACGDNVISMKNTYTYCSNLINAVCGNNVLYMNETYVSCSNLQNAACGDNVLTMKNTYQYCYSLTNAVCGNNVIDMSFTYCNSTIENAVCGPNVYNMWGTYSDCLNLQNAVCGNQVENMYMTYENCSNLISAVCGDNVVNMIQTYYNCPNLIDAVCGNNVEILDSTYCECTNLINAVCGDKVIYMDNTYQSCYNLIDAVCGPNVINMYQTYTDCTNLINAACGDSVIYMDNTYQRCYSLINAVCGNNVTTMSYTYESCENLVNAACGENVLDMTNTYSYCVNLIEAICGNNVVNMVNTYTDCYSLQNAVCGNNVINMIQTYQNCSALIDAVCGDNVINMDYAYYNCEELKNAACGENVRYMNSTYYNCRNLQFAVCGENVENMFRTYSNCKKLQTAVFGNNVNYIGFAYADCPNIQGDVYILTEKTFSTYGIGNCFKGRSNGNMLNIYVKAGSSINSIIYSTRSQMYSILGTPITFTKDTSNNRYYNITQNICVYYI